MTDLNLALRLTADGTGLVGEVKVSREEIERLQRATDGSGKAAKKADQSIDRYGKSASQAAAKTRKLDAAANSFDVTGNKLARTLFRVAGAYIGLASAKEALDALVENQVLFQQLNASLVTVTGSIENAEGAFDIIQQFATDTPFQLQELVTALIKMQALGLKPSERALTSYGNTASSMGKELNQLIEAVADAATGEFERLKEFGIKARNQGDTIAFTFKGVTTTVRNNADDIQGYLLAIGETDFAGGMQRQMDTLGGVISNFEDSWDKTLKAIGETGISDAIESGIRESITLLDELTEVLESGQIQDELQAFSGLWADVFEENTDFASAELHRLSIEFENEIQFIKDVWSGSVDFLVDAFVYFPANVKAAIKIIVAEFEELRADAAVLANDLKGTFATIIGDDAMVDQLIAERLALQQRAAVARQTAQEFIADALAERNAAVDNFEAQRQAAERLRIERRKQLEEGRKGKTLSDFLPDAPEQDQGPSQAQQRLDGQATSLIENLERQIALFGETSNAAQIRYDIESGKLAGINPQLAEHLRLLAQDLDSQIRNKELQDQVRDIEQELLTDIERVNQAYAKRADIVRDGVQDQDKQAQLLRKLEEQRDKELKEIAEKTPTGFDALFGKGALDRVFQDLDNIESRFKALLLQLALEAAQAQLLQLFGQSTGGAKSFTDIFSSGFSGLFGGGKAGGGRVEKGRFYEVNERRPELLSINGRDLLMMGSQSGNVNPNPTAAAPAPAIQQGNTNNVVVLDGNSVIDALGTAKGTRTQLQHVRVNRAQWRAALGL